VAITCALCHSTVDNSFAPGIGRRLDGWANTDLNPGAIIALSPAITNKDDYRSWGPGKFDPRFRVFDGTNVRERHSTTIAVVIPPVYGLGSVIHETFTAEGRISYWNNYVAVTQMGGHGDFSDTRIGLIVDQPARSGDAQVDGAPRVSTWPADSGAAGRQFQSRSRKTRCGVIRRGGALCELS
jgi:hypothetical protein